MLCTQTHSSPSSSIFPAEKGSFRHQPSLSVVVTGCRIHRNIWDNLSVNFHIDLIYTVFQFLVMIWLDAVVFQQTFFKCSFPCVICGAVLVCRGIGRTFCVSGWDYSSKNAFNFSNGMTSI